MAINNRRASLVSLKIPKKGLYIKSEGLRLLHSLLKIWGLGWGGVSPLSPLADSRESPDKDHGTFRNAKFEMPNQHPIPSLKILPLNKQRRNNSVVADPKGGSTPKIEQSNF